jgi:hypothetical protein
VVLLLPITEDQHPGVLSCFLEPSTHTHRECVSALKVVVSLITLLIFLHISNHYASKVILIVDYLFISLLFASVKASTKALSSEPSKGLIQNDLYIC